MSDQDNAVAELRKMEEAAKSTDSKSCIHGEKMLWLPYDRALIPGHIYSEDGMREARISGCCEYHFDKMFDEDWVDVLTGEPGDMHADREAWERKNLVQHG